MNKVWVVALTYADYDEYQYTILCSFENETKAELFAEAYQKDINKLANAKNEHNANYDNWGNYGVVIEETVLSTLEDEIPETHIVYRLNYRRNYLIEGKSPADISSLIVFSGSIMDATIDKAILEAIQNPGSVVINEDNDYPDNKELLSTSRMELVTTWKNMWQQ